MNVAESFEMKLREEATVDLGACRGRMMELLRMPDPLPDEALAEVKTLSVTLDLTPVAVGRLRESVMRSDRYRLAIGQLDKSRLQAERREITERLRRFDERTAERRKPLEAELRACENALDRRGRLVELHAEAVKPFHAFFEPELVREGRP